MATCPFLRAVSRGLSLSASSAQSDDTSSAGSVISCRTCDQSRRATHRPVSEASQSQRASRERCPRRESRRCETARGGEYYIVLR
eukprot:4697889-Pyramimonas_sp.AAC.1